MKRPQVFLLLGGVAALLLLKTPVRDAMTNFIGYRFYKALAFKICNELGFGPVETKYALGLIETESDWNPLAYKWEKALNTASYGLTQILYTTAVSDMKYKGTPEGLYDPETNLRMGLGFLKKKWVQYNWNLEAGVEAYNAGHEIKNMSSAYYSRVVAHSEKYTV